MQNQVKAGAPRCFKISRVCLVGYVRYTLWMYPGTTFHYPAKHVPCKVCSKLLGVILYQVSLLGVILYQVSSSRALTRNATAGREMSESRASSWGNPSTRSVSSRCERSP